MELQGKVIFISEPRSGIAKTTGNPWMTQDYVIETHEQYPKRMMFNVFGEDKIKQYNIQLGDEINVFFDINAREYQGKYYNDIRAWRVDKVDPNQPVQPIPSAGSLATPQPTQQTAQQPPFQQAPTQNVQQQFPPQQTQTFNQSDSEEELPF